MKKLLILIILINYTCFSQEYEIKDKSITIVFPVDSVSKEEIHSRALAGIANLYNSANTVIQLNDIQNNKIVVKGKSTVLGRNEMKPLLPNNGFVPSFYEISYSHTINVDSKDGRYRIIYEVTSGPEAKELSDPRSSGFGISFIKKDENEIEQMIKEKTAPLENMKLFYGKKKREAYKNEIPIAYDFFYNNCLSHAKGIILAINNYIQKNDELTKNDEW